MFDKVLDHTEYASLYRLAEAY